MCATASLPILLVIIPLVVASSSPLYSSAASYPCDPRLILSLNFHDSVLLVVWNTLRTDTILFIKAGCDSRELYDKPTLMVKACPASRQDAREFVFSTNTFHTLLFLVTYFGSIKVFERRDGFKRSLSFFQLRF